MILQYFETDKNNIYGSEKLLLKRGNVSDSPIPSKGSLVMLNGERYRVADLCFESDFWTVDIMMIPDEE
jgi:hypothetical protein